MRLPRKIEARLGGFGFRLARNWVGSKSLLASERFGRRLGLLAFRLMKSRRQRTLSNLQIAFPEWSEDKRRQVAMGVFAHFGMSMADFIRAGKRSKEEVLSSITPEGFDSIEQLLKEGKGIIIVTGHFGYWERLAQFIALQGHPFSVIVRDVNDPATNQLVLEMRTAAGVSSISRGNAARAVLTRLRKNELVGILPDQNSGDIFVPFFGKPCGTFVGPAVLGERAGAPLVPVYCYRTGPGKYHAVVKPKLEPEPGYDRIEGLMRAVNQSLEDIVREHPEQYLWMHDRWKSARKEGLL